MVNIDFVFCLDKFILASDAGVIFRYSAELSFDFLYNPNIEEPPLEILRQLFLQEYE